MTLFRFGLWLLGTLLPFTFVVHSRDADPTEDFCCLSGHMMARKDDMLYIIGGWMLYESAYDGYNGPNPVLRSLNVSKSFQTSQDRPNYARTEEVPGTIPSVSDAAFFSTESGFDLTFGRWSPYNKAIYGKRGAPIEDKKWQYDIATQKWTDAGITLKNWYQPNSPRRIASSMTAWIPSLKKGFLFGGTFASVNGTSLQVTELEEHNGLATYDQATNTWANGTTPLGGIAEGGLVHITTATDEVLIQFGGRSELATRVRKFSEINIYSTKRSKWYTQYLPPDASVPAPRYAFCTALKSASDGSSHQIYIMGGLEASASADAKGGPTTNTIWILSIPSFEWVQLPATSKSTAADPRARIAPKCQAIGEHYIFYYGGRNALSYYGSITCDKKANAAFLFDVNTLTWTDEFIPNEGTYQIPSQVIGLIGGDKYGGSAKKTPVKGWSNPDLATIMTLRTTTARGPGSGKISTHRSSSSPDSPGVNVGAIAGGTVAGVIVTAVAIVLLIVAKLHRKERRERCQRSSHLEPPPSYAAALEDGGSPARFMERNEVNEYGMSAAQSPEDVAMEADKGHLNGREAIRR